MPSQVPFDGAQYLDQAMVVISLIFIGMGIYGIFDAFKKIRFIKDTPTSKIRSAAQGYLELSGTGQSIAGGKLKTPCSQRDCLWYEYRIEQLQQNSQGNGRHWVTESLRLSNEDFMIHDETGVCLIEPSGADVLHSKKFTQYRTRRGKPCLSFRAQSRHTERVLIPGEALFVIGEFRTSYHHRINEKTQRIEESDRPLSEPLNIIAKPKRGKRPFVIGGKSERRLIWNYRARILICLTMIAFGILVNFREVLREKLLQNPSERPIFYAPEWG